MTSPKHLKNLVAQGKIAEALDALTRLSPSDFQNDITLISGRYREYKSRDTHGRLSHAEATAELAQIRHSLVSLIDDLPATDTRRRRLLFVGFAAAIVLLAGIAMWNGYGLRNLISSPNLTAEPREISPDTLPTVPATDKRAAPVTQPQVSSSQKNTPPAPATTIYHIETHDSSKPIIIPGVNNSTIEIKQQ